MADDNNSSNKIIRRKIQIVGGNTATVSLPRTWADINHIGRDNGDTGEVEIRHLPNGSLMITPINSDNRTVERIHIHKIDSSLSLDTLKRIILADFIGGIDIIRLQFKKRPSVTVFNGLQKFVDTRLIGFDLIDLDKTIDVVNMTETVKFEVTRLMEILRVLSLRMLTTCLQWLTDKDVNKDELVILMDQWEIAVDRRTNQMMRTLQLAELDFWIAEKVHLPMAEVLYWSAVTKSVESVADLAFAISHISKDVDITKVDNHVLKQIVDFGKKVADLYSNSLKSFIEDDYMASYYVLEEISSFSTVIQKKWPSSLENYSDNFILIRVYLENISAYARKIAEASIDCEGAKTAGEISSFYST